MKRTAAAMTIPSGAYTDMSGDAYWTAARASAGSGASIPYSNGFRPSVAGLYRVAWSLIGGAAMAAGIILNATSVASFTTLIAGSSASGSVALMTGSGVLNIPAGGVARLFAIGIGGAVNIDSSIGHQFSLEWIGPARGA